MPIKWVGWDGVGWRGVPGCEGQGLCPGEARQGL